MNQLLTALLAVAAAVGGLAAAFFLLNFLSERAPARVRRRVQPIIFALPALALVGFVLVYPVVDTIRISFFDDAGESFVGLDNYSALATDAAMREAVGNNALWILIVPVTTMLIGLVFAWLADRLPARLEKFAKTIIFLPMAISFVGAGTIWGFVYQYQPPGAEQTGLLNAIWTALGNEPVAWLSTSGINNLFLMAVVIWSYAGLACVLLSAAIKAVPVDTIEASRVDGASELQVFGRIVIPQISGTIIMVVTTLVIFVLKIFDIVYVMTNGNFGTEVVADLFIKRINFGEYGTGSAIVVLLLLLVTPVIVMNVRGALRQRASR